MRQVGHSPGNLILVALRLVRFSRMRMDLELAWMLQAVPCDQLVRLGGQGHARLSTALHVRYVSRLSPKQPMAR